MRTDDQHESGGLEDKDRLNRFENQDGSAGPMAQAKRASLVTHTGLAVHTT